MANSHSVHSVLCGFRSSSRYFRDVTLTTSLASSRTWGTEVPAVGPDHRLTARVVAERSSLKLITDSRVLVTTLIEPSKRGFHVYRTWSLLITFPRDDRGMFDRLRQALSGGRGGSSFVECRRCGTRLESADGSCRCCGSTEVATYDI